MMVPSQFGIGHGTVPWSAIVGIQIPDLPQSEPSYSVPTPTRTVNVSTEQELTDAFTDIQPGDEIVLDSGTTWSQIVLPDHGGTSSEWCSITSSSGVPSAGTRITSTDTVATIEHNGTQSIDATGAGVSGWYIYGLKIAPTADGTEAIAIGGADRVVIDRCWVFAAGTPDTAPRIRRGVRANGTNLVVKNSRIEGIIWDGTQTIGISTWSGAGPYLFENNFIEALNQNILIGGASPGTLEDAPADGTIRGNHMYTRSEWSAETGTIFMQEFKAGNRWLFEGNVIQNDFQNFSISVKAPTQVQAVEGQSTSDITFRRNRYKGTLQGIGGYTLLRGASLDHYVDTEKILLEDEWWDAQEGRSIRLQTAPDHITIRRVTIRGTSSSLENVQEHPDGESPHIQIESYNARTGDFGIWDTDDTFANGFSDAYPNHTFTDYWHYWGDDADTACGNGGVDQDQQAELHCIELESNIPSSVGADETTVNDATSGVEDANLPGTP